MAGGAGPGNPFIDLFGGAVRIGKGAFKVNDVDIYDEIVNQSMMAEEIRNQRQALQQELSRIRDEFEDAVRQRDLTEAKKAELEMKMKAHQQMEMLSHLLPRVEPSAQKILLEDDDFRKQFEADSCDAFVVSIDIRRSTDLMLMAVNPKEFARFIVTVSNRLAE